MTNRSLFPVTVFFIVAACFNDSAEEAKVAPVDYGMQTDAYIALIESQTDVARLSPNCLIDGKRRSDDNLYNLNSQATIDQTNGDYAAALEKHVCFHVYGGPKNGVRGVPAIIGWARLANNYPPAKVVLRDFQKDAKANTLANTSLSGHAYMDFKNISTWGFSEELKAAELLTQVTEVNPKLAEYLVQRLTPSDRAKAWADAELREMSGSTE